MTETPDGISVTIKVGAEDNGILGADLVMLVDYLHTALWALLLLRTNTVTASSGVVIDGITQLITQLKTIRDETVRAHHEAGGTLGELARSMGVARSTAQGRRDAVLKSAIDVWIGLGAGLNAWAKESTGSTRNGRIQMPRVECTHCRTSRVKRADGRPVAHKHNGTPCPGARGRER